MAIFAEGKGVPVDRIEHETGKFLDYFKGKGTRRADWMATWRNWMTKAGERARWHER
jgi:hypothetical protein